MHLQKFPSRTKKTDVRKFIGLKEMIKELSSVTGVLVLQKFPTKRKKVKKYLKEFITELCNWTCFSCDEIIIKT